jgi:transposase
MRPHGSPAELERRRKQAIERLDRDVTVHVVAERLGVDRRSVRRWKRAYRHRGEAGLVAQPATQAVRRS